MISGGGNVFQGFCLSKAVVKAPLLLDLFTDATAYYSLQKCKSDVTNVIRVVRLNDNEQRDFTADEITDGTLETWVGSGANNGRVVTWYDQTGNGNHLTRINTNFGPIIVDNGQLITRNGKPAILSIGTSGMPMNCIINPFPSTGDITFSTFGVSENTDIGDNVQGVFGIVSGISGTDRRTIGLNVYDSATQKSIRLKGGNTVYASTETGVIQLSSIYTGGGGAIPLWINGSSKSVNSFSNSGLNIQLDSAICLFNINMLTTLNINYNQISEVTSGYVSEFGWFLNDKTAQRSQIENNIMDRWGL